MTDKYERSAYLKIWNVIQTIKHEMIETGSNIVKITARELCDGDVKEAQKILNRLIQVDKVAKIASTPSELASFFIDKTYGNAPIKLEIVKKEFDKFANEIEIKYKGMANEYQNNQEEQKEESPEKIIYEIKFSEIAKEIRINSFLLSKPDFGSVNFDVFGYLYNHPNQKITLEEIKDKTKIRTAKRLHDIVRDLGFRGNLLKAFFSISKTSIMFRNPIKRKDLNDLSIRWISFKPKDIEID